jgi:hypothetical protein
MVRPTSSHPSFDLSLGRILLILTLPVGNLQGEIGWNFAGTNYH